MLNLPSPGPDPHHCLCMMLSVLMIGKVNILRKVMMK
jgi:hypothetical protein